MTIPERIAELVERYGSLRAVGRITDIDAGYLSRLASGKKARPKAKTQRKLGIRAITTYEKVKL